MLSFCTLTLSQEEGEREMQWLLLVGHTGGITREMSDVEHEGVKEKREKKERMRLRLTIPCFVKE